MYGNERMDSIGYSESSGSWLATGLFALLAAVLLWKLRVRGKDDQEERNRPPSSPQPSQCSSPTCVRCHGEENVKSYLVQRYGDYFLQRDKDAKDSENVEELPETRHSRVVQVIESINDKDSTLRDLYRESGYKVELSAVEPHVWYMPGLDRRPIWYTSNSQFNTESFSSIQRIFENPEVLRTIQSEYEHISEDAGWKTNNTPTGQWSIYPLYNQGLAVEENASKCPQTSSLLANLPQFMQGCVFGNVMFSQLKPGTTIEPHLGPCNFRLRCHLALQSPPSTSCNMKVGSETVSWETGKLLIFDDSFVHSVDYSSPSLVTPQDRVLLIFDVWHPQVSPIEQQVLQFIFAPRNNF